MMQSRAMRALRFAHDFEVLRFDPDAVGSCDIFLVLPVAYPQLDMVRRVVRPNAPYAEDVAHAGGEDLPGVQIVVQRELTYPGRHLEQADPVTDAGGPMLSVAFGSHYAPPAEVTYRCANARNA
jgi:hypothetical protein